MISGRATLEGTARFAARSKAAAGHFRDAMGLTISSIGLGTYLGGEDAATDAGYEACVAVALGSGVNVFDTAINYRGQKSERAIGRALAKAFAEGRAARDEVFVSTKGGFLPHDSEDPRSSRSYVAETFVEPGLAPADEIAQGCHCMSPAYLEDQIERSRRNLNLETIDLYYLHNVETQLAEVGRQLFLERLERAIATLEKARAAGKIGVWGFATWNGLRVPPEHPEHLSLAELAACAKKEGGADSGLRAVQMPVSLGMGHAIVYRSQDTAEGRMPALDAARSLGLAAFGSASIMQGSLAGDDLPDEVVEAFPGQQTSAQKALQFARSAPGMTTALVGVSSPEHAEENFALASIEPADGERVRSLFR